LGLKWLFLASLWLSLGSIWVRFLTIVNNDGQSLGSFSEKKYFPAEPDRLGEKAPSSNIQAPEISTPHPSPLPVWRGEGEKVAAFWHKHIVSCRKYTGHSATS
jgi:hypothetical protein